MTPNQEEELIRELKDQRRELKTIRELLGKVIFYMTEAEAEISEKMRRFVHYMHGVHDVSNMYEERGVVIPPWIMRERERCDDRYRQLLEEANAEGGIFAKVRVKMADDPLNRWDHTRKIAYQKVDGGMFYGEVTPGVQSSPEQDSSEAGSVERTGGSNSGSHFKRR